MNNSNQLIPEMIQIGPKSKLRRSCIVCIERKEDNIKIIMRLYYTGQQIVFPERPIEDYIKIWFSNTNEQLCPFYFRVYLDLAIHTYIKDYYSKKEFQKIKKELLQKKYRDFLYTFFVIKRSDYHEILHCAIHFSVKRTSNKS